MSAHLGFGLEALRAAREEEARLAAQPGPALSALEQVPLDAPYDDPDAVLHVWNGERWVPWEKWRAAAPIAREATAPQEPVVPAGADCVAGDCGGTRVWLVRDGDRWLMFAGSRKAGGRRRDFASPFLAHAMRTAEEWYGAPDGGWRAEKSNEVQP
jgi:hypothetical protein